MRRITIPIALQVRGPILTKSFSIGTLGLDAVMAKRTFENPATGAEETRYYLPGRLVKGLLLEAWQELSTVGGSYGNRIPEWLGEASVPDSDDKSARGRLVLDDFVDWQTIPDAKQTPRFRIAIDEERCAADAGKLQVMESPYAPGQLVRFVGHARFLAADGEERWRTGHRTNPNGQ